MSLSVGTRVRHESFGEGVIAHGPIWAIGKDGRGGHIISGPEAHMSTWGSEQILCVVEWDEAPKLEGTGFSQLRSYRAWLISSDGLEEIPQ